MENLTNFTVIKFIKINIPKETKVLLFFRYKLYFKIKIFKQNLINISKIVSRRK